MRKPGRSWVRVKGLSTEEKAGIAAACERPISETLKRKFLPEIRPTAFNYPIDITGKWRGGRYSFVTRFRSGDPDDLGEEFDEPFAALEHEETCLTETRFDVMWRRHTGQWWRLHASLPLDEALRKIETDPILRPPV